MIILKRTNSKNSDFLALVQKLDRELAERDGEEHSFYAQFNKVDLIKHTVVAYVEDVPVACGAIKAFDENAMEVKRMYVDQTFRGQQIGTKVLNELESWAKELGFSNCILETGKRQPEAIRLYEKNGYRIIPNYGQYAQVKNSVCFRKTLITTL